MNEDHNQKQVSSQQEEEKAMTSSAWKRLIRKKWFFPAVYLVAAALILAFITWYQSPDEYALDQDQLTDASDYNYWGAGDDPDSITSDSDALPVNRSEETMIWPVPLDDQIQIVLGYFDDEASEEEQLNAMVEYERSFHPNQGIDFAHQNGETFEVLAALSGTVLTAEKDPLVGYVVELEHDDDLVTVYQGLEDLQVEAGDKVKQGDTLGRAGRSIFKQEIGVHAHFRVIEAGEPTNPYAYLTPADAIPQAEASDDAEAGQETETEQEGERDGTDSESTADVEEDGTETSEQVE